uniref:Uncharacterized protein n=1 Tax=Rhizophora mucronata TaxID=61149 RepID=A0A2P2QSJ5_RHIMU
MLPVVFLCSELQFDVFITVTYHNLFPSKLLLVFSFSTLLLFHLHYQHE